MPIDKPISVRRVKLSPTLYGEVYLQKNKYLIRIDKNLLENSAMDILIHELSHVMAWSCEEHGREWGIAYSKVYRLYLKWIDE